MTKIIICNKELKYFDVIDMSKVAANHNYTETQRMFMYGARQFDVPPNWDR